MFSFGFLQTLKKKGLPNEALKQTRRGWDLPSAWRRPCLAGGEALSLGIAFAECALGSGVGGFGTRAEVAAGESDGWVTGDWWFLRVFVFLG